MPDTIVALATALGAGSIAVVRLSGPKSLKIANKTFIGKNLEKAKPNTIHFGRIKNNETEIDQVLISVFRSPNSYTGEDTIEISCHSNYFIVEEIINVLIKNGARIAKPGEFTLRAFLNQKIDLSQAEAISNVVTSQSVLATRNSIMQLEGRLSEQVLAIKKNLIDLISFLELDLDFSEEDLEVISKNEIINKIDQTTDKIKQLIKSFNKAKYLSGALEIAIIGKPNAGKSLLLNNLLGEERAIVTKIPGTTRDTIEENLSLKNMLLKISDTAGIRFSKNQVEAIGIERTWKRVERADLILWVIDISRDLDEADQQIFNRLKSQNQKDVLMVKNKIDIKINTNAEQKIKKFSLPFVEVSAKLGTGIDKLKEQISANFSEKYKNLGEELIITNKRQAESLESTLRYLINAKKAINSRMGYEFVVVELRNAIDYLGLITGETASDDILNNIFSGFCIGK